MGPRGARYLPQPLLEIVQVQYWELLEVGLGQQALPAPRPGHLAQHSSSMRSQRFSSV